MREKLLSRLADLVVAARGRILLVAAVIAIVSIPFAAGIEVQGGHSALFDRSRPHWARLFAFLERFGSPNVLFVMVEGGTPATRRTLMERLTRSLPGAAGQPACGVTTANARGCVKDVLARIDITRLAPYAPLFIPPKHLQPMVELLKDPQTEFVQRLLSIRDLPTLLMAVEADLGARSQKLHSSQGSAEQAKQAMVAFTAVIDEIAARAGSDARSKTALLPALSSLFGSQMKTRAMGSGLDDHGFLVSRDQALHLAMVRPHSDSDDPKVILPFVRYVKEQALRQARELNGACKSCGRALTVQLTGLPALVATEKNTLTRDLRLTSAVAALAVLAIFVFGFRSLRQGLLGIIPLAVSLLFTLMVVRLTVGRLNLATSAFLPTALGLGIDFSIHLLSRYNEARHRNQDAVAATRAALMGAGPGMITGGLTTAAAFLAMAANEFRGFVELGSLTALSVLTALVATLVLGPALLCHPHLARLQTPPPARPARESAPLLRTVLRFRALFLLGGLVLTMALLWQARTIPWSHNYLDLLPKDDPAALAMATLAKRTQFSAEVATLEAKDLAEARRLTVALRAKSSVGRVESLARFLPADGASSRALLRQLAPLSAAIATTRKPTMLPAAAAPSQLQALVAATQSLADRLQDMRFDAQGAGKMAEAKLLEGPLRSLRQLLKGLAVKDAALAERLRRTNNQVVELLQLGRKALLVAPTRKPLSAETIAPLLPRPLAERLYHRGRLALYVYPSSWIWQPGFLERFVADLRSVDGRVTGFPVTHLEAHLLIRRGFRMAALVTSIVLLLMLFFDFRSLRYTLLAAVPVGLGLAWTWGGISLLGMKYNFANIIGFPLIIGIGVASGVHILHRFRQEGRQHVARVIHRTGLPILLSGLTTMAGFGSLVLAHHRGAASLGALLLLGVSACLLSGLVVLPALLNPKEKQGQADGEEDPPSA